MALPLRRLEGKYEILRKLSEGGMGAIYRVRHRLLGDERVVKIMRPHLEDDDSLRRRFEHEARAASRLSHPNIAQLYDFTIDEEGFAYIVMEYIQGMTLEELVIREQELPLGLVLEIAHQSLLALGHLHAHDIVHRDISPDNLILSQDFEGGPRVKLIDLGISKSLEKGTAALTATGMFVGKLRYASPEQFNETGAGLSPRSDLYSFGLVLYELLTGQYPIAGDGATSIIAGHLFRPPVGFAETDPNGRVPQSLRRAVLKALAKRPEERFESAESLAAALAGERRPGDLDQPAVRGILALTLEEPRGNLRAGPGTTQSRLDEHFSSQHPTPLPIPVPEDATATSRLRDRDTDEEAVRPKLKLVRTGEEDAAEDPLASLLRRLDDLIAAGRLSEAHEVLREAERAGTADRRLEEAAQRLHEKTKAVHKPRIKRLVREAKAARTGGDADRAVELLREALTLVPGDAKIADLLREARREARHYESETRRGRQVEGHATEISSLLQAGELSQAEEKLSEVGRLFGKHRRWSELRHRLDDLREERHQRVAGLVEEAESLIERDLLEDAYAVLDQALELTGDDPKLLWRRAEVGGEIEKRAAAQHHEEALAHVVARIESALERGEAEQARRHLEAAEATLGAAPVLERLRRRLHELLGENAPVVLPPVTDAERPAPTEKLRHSHADQLVSRARSLSQAEEFTAAQRALREAVDLIPEHSQALELSRSLDTLVAFEAKQHDTLAQEVTAIRTLLTTKRPGEAMKRLQETIARFGDHEELKALRVETAQAFLDDDATYGDDTYVSAVDPFSGPPQDGDDTFIEGPPPEALPPPDEPRASVADLPLAGGVPEPEPSPPPAPTTISDAADLGFRGPGVEPVEAATVPPPARSSLDWSNPRLWLLVVVLMIVFVLLGVFLARSTGDDGDAADPNQIETEDVPRPKI